MHRLKKKTELATPEPFVFATINSMELSTKFDDIRDVADKYFQVGHYKEAISKYTDAIHSLERLEPVECARELAIFYGKRAAINEQLGNIALCIADATQAIKIDDSYAKAYYRRAKAYVVQEKLYCALQDILQACILERFRNEAYNSVATEIHAHLGKQRAPLSLWSFSCFVNSNFLFCIFNSIELLPLEENAYNAYKEMNCAIRKCRHCILEGLGIFKDSTLFDQLITAIDESAPNIGYNRAIRGLNNFDFDELMAGCSEQLACTERTLNYHRCVIMRGFAICIVNPKREDINMDTIDIISQLIEIIENVPSTDNLTASALLCLAILYDLQVGKKERTDSLLNIVEEEQPDHLGVFVIRSGLLREPSSTPTPSEYRATVRCCQLKPTFVDVHFQKLQYEHKLKIIPSNSGYMRALQKLVDQFPNDMHPRIVLYNELLSIQQFDKARQLIDETLAKFPHKAPMMYTPRAMLKPMDPSSVDLLKKGIIANVNDTTAYMSLFEYYEKKTHEYAKALEVLNRAYLHCNGEHNLERVFVYRHKLLTRIIMQNAWHKL